MRMPTLRMSRPRPSARPHNRGHHSALWDCRARRAFSTSGVVFLLPIVIAWKNLEESSEMQYVLASSRSTRKEEQERHAHLSLSHLQVLCRMETVEHKMLLARMQALVTCNSALRILVSLYSLRSEIISEKPTEDAITDSERYERLVGAIEVLQADLQAERQKVQQLAQHVYTDLARLLLFLAGILSVIAFFQYTELPTSTCRKKYT